MISLHRPDGIAWIVAHDPAGRAIAVAPAPPAWAPPELTQAVSGALGAAVTGNCAGCGARRLAPWPGSAPVRAHVLDLASGYAPGPAQVPPPLRVVASPTGAVITDVVPHTSECPWSRDAIARLAAASRPAGEHWTADMREDVIDTLTAYIGDLTELLVSPETL